MLVMDKGEYLAVSNGTISWGGLNARVYESVFTSVKEINHGLL